MAERKKKVDKAHELPISRQCLALDISRSSAYRTPAGVSADDIDLMRKLDELHLRRPFKGSRRLRDDFWDNYGLQVNRKRVQRLMRLMGIRALHPGAKTTHPNPQHKVYPYLLRTWLIHGARAALSHYKNTETGYGRWLVERKATLSFNKAAVALANKNARIIWSLLHTGEEFNSDVRMAAA